MVDRSKGASSRDLTSGDAYRISYGSQASSQGIQQGTPADWFGPLNPMAPVAPIEVMGRQTDFPSGYNLDVSSRPYEAIKFADMRALADGYDILRILIETRKDQMEKLTWTIRPRAKPDSKPGEKPKIGADVQKIIDFFHCPDGENDWGTWLRKLLEDMFVIDAASLYAHKTRGGELLGLEQLDGATIKRVIDDYGRTPKPPVVAFQQVLKGFPAINYDSNQLIYLPRNPRVHKFYGYSPVEQIMMTINIGLRRELFQLQYYTEGNIPEALVGTPDLWTPKQISDFQASFDAMLAGNQAYRRRLKFVPGGVAKTFQPTKEAELTGKTDEWLARVCCFAFSVSPQPFIQMMNRATAQTAHDASIEEGLAPVQNWVVRLVNRVLRQHFNRPDLEFAWEDDREVDQKLQMEVITGYVEKGVMRVNEGRDKLGLDDDPAGDVLRVYGAAANRLDVNDDAPSAGEAHATEQENAAADREAGIKEVPAAGAVVPGGKKAPPGKKLAGGAVKKAAGTFRTRSDYWRHSH